MPAQFPANVPTFSTKVDFTDDILADHVNRLQEEVAAFALVIGTGVGANDPRTPAGGGSGNTLHSRLQYVEANKSANGHNHSAFPFPIVFGGATGYAFDYDGGTSFQGRRVSDNAAWPLYLNWFGGGRVHARDLYTDWMYVENSTDTYHLHTRAGAYFTGDIGANHVQSRTRVQAVNGASVFDNSFANDWANAQVRAGAISGAGNAIYSAWANDTASCIKWFSGNQYWEFLGPTGQPANGYVGVLAAYFQSASSRRFKTAITDIALGLAEVMQMRPVSFRLTNGAYASVVIGNNAVQSAGSIKNEETPELGFIAEEMDEIVPHVVSYDDEDATPLGINYNALVPVLAKAIQEQQAMIEELRAEIAALKA